MSTIKDLKGKVKKLDYYLDRRLTQAEEVAEKSRDVVAEYSVEAKRVAKDLTDMTSESLKDLDRFGDELTRRFLDFKLSSDVSRVMIKKPLVMVLLVCIVAGAIAGLGVFNMLENIKGDLDIYLPEDHETTQIIGDVNSVEGWSTDLILLYVETDNAQLPGAGNSIKDLEVLNEISAIEEALDWDRNDFGANDEVTFILSVSTIIKELNTTSKNVANAMESEFGWPVPDQPGEYAIPQDQNDIDKWYSYIPPEILSLLAADTNGDNITDTTAVLIGVEEVDQAAFLAKIDRLISENAVNSRITPTGPVPMTNTLTERTFREFFVVVPISLALIFACLLVYHRTWKIVIIAAVPLMCTLGLTFGLIGLIDIDLAPQIILVAPILLALGVAYGLYIANRYSEERESIPDKEERMHHALTTTGRAVFLSAVTTAIGFASLILVNMLPLRVLGFGLTAGILIAWAVTMLVVPSLVLLLDYQKKSAIRNTEKLGMIPLRHRKKLIAVALFVTVVSLSMIPMVKPDLNLVEMSPQDEAVIQKMSQYSDVFDGGQMGMVVVTTPRKVDPNAADPYVDTLKDVDVLDKIDSTEIRIIDSTQEESIRINPPLGVVDVMKMVRMPEEALEGLPAAVSQLISDQFGDQSFWDVIHNPNLPADCGAGANALTQVFCYQYHESPQQAVINIFYNSISDEFRRMLATKDYDRSMIYIDIPAKYAAEDTKVAVTTINDVLDQSELAFSHLTGFAAVVVAVNDLILINSFTSMFMAIVLVFVVLIVIFRSLRYAVLTILPVLLVIGLQPITYVMSGVDLNLLTAMLGSIVVGVGIDFGIHITERVRSEGESLRGIKKAVETTGMSFFEAATTVIAGLCSIFVVNIPSIQEFTVMTILLLAFSVLGAMFVLPAVYAVLSADKARSEEAAAPGAKPQRSMPLAKKPAE